MIELKGKHYYGLGTMVLGMGAILFGLVYGFVNQSFDTTVKVSFAVGLVGLAVFAALEIDLIARVLNTRQARYGAEAAVMVLAFLGVVVLLNYIFTRDRLKQQWDLTETKEHTLAPETLKVLAELDEPIKAVGFYTAQSAFSRETAEDLLKNYRASSNGKFDYEIVDPQLRPTLAQEYGITRDATLILERGAQRETVNFADESSLTNAIVRLNNPTMRVVYFISGHGEHAVDDTGDAGFSQIRTELENVNYQVRTLAVITATIPADASAIVIAGPRQPYAAAEVDVIRAYLAGGGKAVILAEPSPLTDMKPGDSDLLADYLSQSWGLTLRDDLVVDPSQYIAQFGPTVPATQTYGFSTITNDLKGLVSFFPTARSVAVADIPVSSEITAAAIIRSGPNAWGETDFQSIGDGTAAPTDGADASGELVIAATAENSTTKARVVLFGDAEFAINGFSRGANGIILLNAIKWAAADDQLIGLSPKPQVARSLNVYTNRDMAVIFLLACLLPPVLVLIGAGSLWWSRRRNA